MAKKWKLSLGNEIWIDVTVFIFLAALTFFIRYDSFALRIINWDESLYFIWGKELLQGILPYVSVMEDKPVGIGFVYAFAMLLFGKTMLSLRILSWLSIFATSFIIYKIGNILFPFKRLTGILAGSFYAVFSYLNRGISANTEIFFVFFVVWAFYLFFKNKNKICDTSPGVYRAFFFIGLLLGCSFFIKYVTAFDIISMILMCAVAIFYLKPKGSPFPYKHLFRLYLFIFLGWLVPLTIIVIIYALCGKFSYLVEANIFIWKYVPLINPTLKVMLDKTILHLGRYWPLLLCLTPLFFYSKFSKKTRLNALLLLIWFLIIEIELVFFLTRYWQHYYVVLLPSLSLLSALLLSESYRTIKIKKSIKPFVLLLVLFLISKSAIYLIGSSYEYINRFQNAGIFHRVNGALKLSYKDPAEFIAGRIAPNITKDDYVFTISLHYILNGVLDCKHPTRFIMPYMLIDPSFDSLYDKVEDMKNIIALKPKYVVIEKHGFESKMMENFKETTPYKLLEKELEDNYFIESIVWGDNIYLYRRKSQ